MRVGAEHLAALAVSGLDLLTDPWEPGFMRRAFAEAVLCGATCGALGCFVLLRRLAFLGESISHTIVLGAALALALGVSLGLAGVVVAVTTALLTGAIAGDRRLSADTATGIVLPALFGAGVGLLALTGAERRLDDLLFGSILGVGSADLVLAALVAAAVAVMLGAAGKELMLVSFDRAGARALGYPVALLDAALLVLVAVTVVVGLRAVGSILLAGLLLGPPLAARVTCKRFWPMVAVAATVGALCAVGGLYASWYVEVAAGPAIVLVVAAATGLVALLAAVRGRGRTGRRAGGARASAAGAR